MASIPDNYEFGEKVEPQTTNVLLCCDGCKHFNSRYTACMFCFKRNLETDDELVWSGTHTGYGVTIVNKAESEE